MGRKHLALNRGTAGVLGIAAEDIFRIRFWTLKLTEVVVAIRSIGDFVKKRW